VWGHVILQKKENDPLISNSLRGVKEAHTPPPNLKNNFELKTGRCRENKAEDRQKKMALGTKKDGHARRTRGRHDQRERVHVLRKK